MKHIIILEGIATSGKTSVKNELEKILAQRGVSFTFIGEEETLMPLLHNTDVHIANNHVVKLLNKYLTLNTDVLIFDRLYLTHMWRTRASLSDFMESTALLSQHATQICFLEIPGRKLEERIALARSHRDEAWNAYVSTKGKTQREILAYYAGQQKELLELLQRVSIPHTIFDTGDMDFRRVAGEVGGYVFGIIR